MPVSTAKLVAEITADTSGLEKGVAFSKKSIKDLTNDVKKMSLEVEALNKSVKASSDKADIAAARANQSQQKLAVTTAKLGQETAKYEQLQEKANRQTETSASLQTKLDNAKQRVKVAEAAHATQLLLTTQAQEKASEAQKNNILINEKAAATAEQLAVANTALAKSQMAAAAAAETLQQTVKSDIWTQWARKIEDGNKAVQRIDNVLRKTQETLRQTGLSMSATITLPIVALGKASFDAAVKYDSMMASLAAIKKPGEDVNVELEKIRKASQLPGASFEALFKGDIALRAMKMSGSDALQTLTQFGNEFARLNAGQVDNGAFQRIVADLQKMSGEVRVSGREIRMLATLIPSTRSILRELYGTADTQEIGKLGINGVQMIHDLTNAFAQMPRAANTAQNELKNLNNEIFLMKAEIGQALIPVFRDFIHTALPAIHDLVDWFKNLDPAVQQNIIKFAALAAVVGPVLYVFSGIAGVLRGLVSGFNVIRTVVLTVGTGLQSLGVIGTATGTELAASGAMASAAWLPVVAPLTAVIAIIGVGALAIYGLKKGYDALFPSIEDVDNALERQAKIQLDHSKHAAEVAELANQYARVFLQVGPLNEKKAKLAEITQQLIKLDPSLYAGLNSQHEVQVNLNKVLELGNQLLADRAKLLNDQKNSTATNIGTIAQTRDTLKGQMDDLSQRIIRDNSIINGQFNKNDVGKSDAYKQLGIHGMDDFVAAQDALKERMPGLIANMNQMRTELDNLNKQFDEGRKKLHDLSHPGGTSDPNNVKISPSDALAKGHANEMAEETAKAWKVEMKKAASDFGLKLVSDFRPGALTHANQTPSYHSMSAGKVHGLAMDFGGTKAEMDAFFQYVKKEYMGHIKELIYSPDGIVKNNKYSTTVQNKVTRDDHYNHVHVALSGPLNAEDNKAMEYASKAKESIRAANAELKEMQELLHKVQMEMAAKMDPYRAGMAQFFSVQLDRLKEIQKKNPEIYKQMKSLFDQDQMNKKGIEMSKGVGDFVGDLIQASMKEFAKQDSELRKDFMQRQQLINQGFNAYEAIVPQAIEDWMTASNRADNIINNRASAISHYAAAHEKQIRVLKNGFNELGMEMLGVVGIGDALGDSILQLIGETYDENKKNEAIKNRNQLLSETNKQLALAMANDPFEKFVMSMEKYDDVERKFKLPEGLSRDFLKGIFDTQQDIDGMNQFRSIQNDILKQSAEMTARNPFELWRLSFMKLNEQTGKFELLHGISDRALKDMYELKLKMDMMKTFAQGVSDIFGRMIGDIQTKGFGGLFHSITDGFQKLLVKMAMDYLQSQLYQLLLNSLMGSNLFGLFGGGGGGGVVGGDNGPGIGGGLGGFLATGGSAFANRPYVVGEKGPEIFVPKQHGYVIPHNKISFSPGNSTAIYQGVDDPASERFARMYGTGSGNSNANSTVHNHNNYITANFSGGNADETIKNLKRMLADSYKESARQTERFR